MLVDFPERHLDVLFGEGRLFGRLGEAAVRKHAATATLLCLNVGLGAVLVLQDFAE